MANLLPDPRSTNSKFPMPCPKRLVLAALVLPITAAVPPLSMAQDNGGRQVQSPGESGLMPGRDRFPQVMRFSTAAPEFTSPRQSQVRIEQRVIVRIAPMAEQVRRQIRAQQQSDEALVLSERPLADCIPLNTIVGVGSANDNRLVFLMRNRRLVGAQLDRSCSARDFYAGFYVDRHADGRLCVKRDELHARRGATCTVASLSRIVARKE